MKAGMNCVGIFVLLLLCMSPASPRAFPTNDNFGFASTGAAGDDQGESTEACAGLTPFQEALERSVETMSSRYCPVASPPSTPCVTPSVGVLRGCVEDGNLKEDCVEGIYEVILTL